MYDDLFDDPQVSQQFYAMSGRKQQPQKKKNFWVDQISTAGGILGGIGGSFVAPIAGTAAGAGAGSALGEAIENLITGDSLGKNVVKEGALGAVFGAGPMKLLKGGAALAAGKGIKGAAQAASTPLRRKAGEGLLRASDDLAAKSLGLTGSQKYNFLDKFGKPAGNTIKKYGISSADDIVTKGLDPLQKEFDKAISLLPGVSKETLKKQFDKEILALSKKGPTTFKEAAQTLRSEADSIINGFGDTIDAKELNTLRQQFDSLVNYSEKAANPAMYRVNKRAADVIRKTLQETADTLGIKPSGRSLKEVGRELSALRKLSDDATKQAQNSGGTSLLGLREMLGATAGGGATAGPMGAAGGFLATKMLNSPTGRRAVAKSAEVVGSKLVDKGTIGQTTRGIAGRLGAVGAVQGAVNQAPSLEDSIASQSLLNNSIVTQNSPMSANAPMNGNMMSGLYSQNEQLSSGSPYTKENLMADLQRDPQNSMKYLEYYATLDELFNRQEETKPLNATQQQQSNNAISALQDIQLIRSELQRDPKIALKANLPGGSLTERLTGSTNFEAARKNIGDVLARLRSGAAISNDEYVRYVKLLPSSYDKPEDANNKLNRLEQLLGSFAFEANGRGSAGSLEEALVQYQ